MKEKDQKIIEEKFALISSVLGNHKGCMVACSGGLDSLLLGILANRIISRCVILHTVGPSVQKEATERVKYFANQEKWNLRIFESEELNDERFISNPVNRCYFCKINLFGQIEIYREKSGLLDYDIMSGDNTDDLNEYRPGLKAAEEHSIFHPFIEAGFGKEDIRNVARFLKLSFSELPASPCLSSRIYTGTRVTSERLDAIGFAENFLMNNLELSLVRCRIKDDHILIEVLEEDREQIRSEILNGLGKIIQEKFSFIKTIKLDDFAYKPGRAFIGKKNDSYDRMIEK